MIRITHNNDLGTYNLECSLKDYFTEMNLFEINGLRLALLSKIGEVEKLDSQDYWTFKIIVNSILSIISNYDLMLLKNNLQLIDFTIDFCSVNITF